MDPQEAELNFEKAWNLSQETNHSIKETGRFVQETSREIKEICKRVDGLSSKWGLFMEELLVPSVKHLFNERGITVKKVLQCVKIHKRGTTTEIDLMVINREYVVLFDVKSTLAVENINELLKKLARFKSFFPEYADRKVIGAVAGIVFDEGADRYAYKSGLFVIGQSGETVKILNDKKFVPRAW